MRCTVASVGLLAAAVIVATFIWPEHRGNAVIGKAVAESSDKPNPDIDKSKLEKLEKAAEELPDDLNAKTEAVLNQITSIMAADSPTPLTDILDELAVRHKIQIYIDNQAVKDAGVDPTSTLYGRNLQNVRLKTALDLILSEYNLGFMLRDGLLIVSSKDKLNQELETRVYDCREILSADVGRFREPTLKTKERKQEFPKEGKETTTGANADTVRADPKGPADSLIDVVVAAVEPESWTQHGGNATISEYDGLLVVSQTNKVHAKVAMLLDQIQSKLASRSAK